MISKLHSNLLTILFSILVAFYLFPNHTLAANLCENAELISVLDVGSCDESNSITTTNLNNTLQLQPGCIYAEVDAFFKFVVPENGKIQLNFDEEYSLGASFYTDCQSTELQCKFSVSNELFSDLPAGDTIILQIIQIVPSDFKFCIEEGVSNATCANALPIEAGLSDSCADNMIEVNNINYLNDNEPSCSFSNAAKTDVFYELTVPSSGLLKIDITDPYYTQIGLTIYDTCGGTELFCDRSFNPLVISNLPANETVILQFFQEYGSQFEFCVQAPTTSPNNDCANAEFINIGAVGECPQNAVNATFINNGQSYTSTCSDGHIADIFYQFVVPESGQIRFIDKQMQYTIYDNCGGSVLFCDNYGEGYLATGLPAGDTLILQLFSSGFAKDFFFCIEDAPPTSNSDCVNAEFITVASENTCIDSKIRVDISNNLLDRLPECGNRFNADAFYEFTVPENGKVAIETASGTFSGIALYNSCSGVQIGCYDYLIPPNNLVEVTNLPAGENVILQLFQGDIIATFFIFDLCVYELAPSTNNTCENAMLINLEEENTCSLDYSFVVENTNNDLETIPSCSEATSDAYYKFVPQSSGKIIFYLNDPVDVGAAVYDTCNGNELACLSNVNDGFIENLSIGDTLILQLFQLGIATDFNLCIEEIPLESTITPSNNNCENATFIELYESGNCVDNFTSLNIDNNTLDIEPSCIEPNKDAFYQFAVPQSGQIRWQIDGFESYWIAIYDGCLGEELFCDVAWGAEYISDLPAGDTLILQISTNFEDDPLNFCIEESNPTINNLCENTELILVNPLGTCPAETISFSLNDNTLDKTPECEFAGNYYVADIFYKLVVPPSGAIRFEGDRVGIALYNDCMNTPLYCNLDFQSYYSTSTFVANGLPPGDTLIAHFFSEYRSDYEICIEEAISTPNNDCANAEQIIVNDFESCTGNQLNISLINNTLEREPGCNRYDTFFTDAYYTFTAPLSGQIRIVGNNIGAAFYNSCTGNEIKCIYQLNDDQGDLVQLSPGEEIIMQVFSRINEEVETYFCIEDAPATPNNNCANAELIEVVQPDACDANKINTNFQNNTFEFVPSCVSFDNYNNPRILADIYYTVVVPESGQFRLESDSYYAPDFIRYGAALYDNCYGNELFCTTANSRFILFPNLTPNDTILLQIFTNNYNDAEYLSFCLTDSPAEPNSLCENAIPLAINESEICPINTIKADLTNSTIDIIPFCYDEAKFDVFYNLNVPQSGNINIYASNTSGLAVYSDCNVQYLEDVYYCERSFIIDDFFIELSNLEPNSNIILHVFNKFSRVVEICAEDPGVLIANTNDTCESALPLTIGDENDCPVNIEFTNNADNTLDKIPICSNYASLDVYFTFQVPESGQIRFADNNFDDFGASIYSSCEDIVLYCSENVLGEIASNLPAGEMVILQLFQTNPSAFVLCLEDAPATPNNLCGNAQPVIVSEQGTCGQNSIEANLISNTYDLPAECAAYFNPPVADAFYEFVVPPSGQIRFNNVPDFAGVALYQSCNDTTLYCTNYRVDEDLIKDLPPGETIVLQIFEEDPSSFTFCIEEAPPSANNTCANAQLVTVGTEDDCTENTFDILNLNNNTNDSIGCGATTSDSYFKFIVPPSGQVYFMNRDYAISIYDSCDGNEIYCSERSTVFDLISGLPVGEEVIARISSNRDNYSSCVIDAPSSINNNCEDALPILTGTEDECILNKIEIDASFNLPSEHPVSCASENRDAYFRFTVPPSGAVRLIYNSTRGNNDFTTVFYNECNGSEIICLQNGRNKIVADLNPGEDIILRVVDRFLDLFDLCVVEIISSANNNCENAAIIEVSELGICNEGLTLVEIEDNTLNTEVNCEFDVIADAFYQFEVPESGQIRIYNLGSSAGVAIYPQCDSEAILCERYNENELITNLTSGEILILQVFQRNPRNFELCIEDAKPPQNNNCENALPITIGVPGECNATTFEVLNINSKTTNPSSCQSTDEVDSYFSFTVPSSGSIYLTTSTRVGFAIYDACEGNELFCDEDVSRENITDLPVGENLILKVFNRSNRENFSLCIEEPLASDNDLCADATSIVISSDENCLSTNITHNTTDLNSCTDTGDGKDIYFSFTGPASGSFKLTSSGFVTFFAVYNDCNSAEVVCDYFLDETIVGNLNPGENYILKLYSESNNILDLCFSEVNSSENNLCDNATLLQVAPSGADCEDYCFKVNNEFNSLNNDACNIFRAQTDSYFKFVVPPAGQVQIERVFSSRDTGAGIFNACGGEVLFCSSDITNNYNLERTVARNLTPGDTVILQLIEETGSEFFICVQEVRASENDLCENRTEIIVGSSDECLINQVEINTSYNSLQFEPSCYNPNSRDNDAFFEFTAPPSGYVKTSSSSYNFGLSIYQSCDGAELYCFEQANSQVLPYLPPGEQFILQVYKFTGDLCLIEVEPTENNNCENALPVQVASFGNCNDVYVTANNQDNVSSSDANCNSSQSADIFYQVTVPPSGSFKIRSFEFDLGVALYSSCSGVNLYCRENYWIGQPIRDLFPGETIILHLFQDVGSNFEFCLEEAIPSDNNTCDNALPVTVGSEEECLINEVTTNAIDNTLEQDADCPNFSGRDAYYEFICPPSGIVKLVTDREIDVVFSDNGCNLFAEECFKDGQNRVFNLTPGETYTLQVAGFLSEFSLCIIEATSSVNNTCDNATVVEVTPEGTCIDNSINVNIENNSFDLNSCFSYGLADIFYQFVVPPSGQIKVTTSQPVRYALYESCSAESISCQYYNDSYIFKDLVPRENIILQLAQDNPSNFTLCIEEVTPSINNECTGRVLVNVNPAGICDELVLVPIEVNDLSLNSSCTAEFNYPQQDLVDAFYSFEVPESGQVRFSSDARFSIALFNSCLEEAFYCNTSIFNEVIKDLSPGETLTVQIFRDFNTDFELCIQDATPTSNDICENAQLLEVNTDGTCTNIYTIEGNENNSVQIFPPCDEEMDVLYDLYYQFVVPPSGTIRLTTDGFFSFDTYFAMYEICNGEALFCDNAFSNPLIDNLPPGEIVLLQFASRYNQTFNLCILEAKPSANNFCNNATPVEVITIDSCLVNFTLGSNLNNTLQQTPSCASSFYTPIADSYFSFIAPDNGAVQISAGFNMGGAIYQACDSVELFCSNNIGGQIDGLPPNTDLILQLFDRIPREQFGLCITTIDPSPNDNCEDALLIPIQQEFNCLDNSISGNLTNNSMIKTPSCEKFSEKDAYYKFVVPESGNININQTSSLGFALYHNCDEDHFYCEDNPADQFITGLTPGDTLLLQAFETNFDGIYNFCIETKPFAENNNCDQAKSIEVQNSGACPDFPTRVILDKNTLDISPSCGEAIVDAFYKITVPESGQVKITASANLANISIFSDCAGEELFCGSFIDDMLFENLPQGETITIQFFSTVASNFLMCVEDSPQTTNNTCDNAIQISVQNVANCGENSIGLSLINNNMNYQPNCEDIVADAFYEFTVPQTGAIKISANSSIGAAIYTACEGDNLFCNNSANDLLIDALPVGEILILQVFQSTQTLASNNFEFCLHDAAAAPNDNCENTEEMLVRTIEECSENLVIIYNANNSLNYVPSCGMANADVYYELDIPSSGNINISTSRSSGSPVNLAIYESCEGTELFCGTTIDNTIVSDLPANETVILQFYQFEPGSFGICIEDAVRSGNTCAEAIPIVISNADNCSQNTQTAIIKYNNLQMPSNCNPYAQADIFYEIVVPPSGIFRLATDLNDVGAAFYSACGGTEIYCRTNINGSLINLPPNETLILQLFQNYPENFDFCLLTFDPATNDECENAISININDHNNCSSNGVTVYNLNNTATYQPSCGTSNADSFYEIEVPETGALKFSIDRLSVGGAIFDACNGNELFCLQNLNQQIIYDLPETIIVQLFQEQVSDFEFCIEEHPTLPSNNECAGAALLCGEALTGSNQYATASEILFGYSCISFPIRNIWYSFETNDSGNPVEIEVVQNNCNSEEDNLFNNFEYLEISVAKGDCSGYIEQTCEILFDETSIYRLNVFNTTPNSSYYVIVDAVNQVFCDFTIRASGGIKTCDDITCEAPVVGQVIGEDDCDLSDVDLIIKDGSGTEVGRITSTDEGFYNSQENVYPCGNYTIEIDTNTLPNCFEGETGPLNFIIDNDGQVNGVDFIDASCSPPNPGEFECEE